MSSKCGLLVPLVPSTGKSGDVGQFLGVGYDLVQEEPETLQWFAVKYAGVSPETYAIFDTFASDSGRVAHLNGKIGEALGTHGPKILSQAPPEINKVEVLASKVVKSGDDKTAGLSVGLRVLFTAKADKVQTVKDFLINALPLVEAEPKTPVWYAIQFADTAKFGIVDFFPTEEGRNDHLGGKVAAALFSSVDELLTGTPEVVKVDVLAAKVA